MRVDPLQVLTKLAAAQNIPTRRVTPPFEGLDEFDYGLRRSLDPQFDWQEFGQLLLDNTPEQTLLFVEETFELHFALFRIPDEENTVFLVGPWTFGQRSEKSRKWGKRHLGVAGESAVQEYYNGVKVLGANDFYSTIRVLVGMMFHEDELKVKQMKEFLPFQFLPDIRYFNEPKFQKDIPISMLEQRYESENRILEAVGRGDEEAAVQKVMNYVNLNVAEPLTLKSLAAMCFISPSYLSALFKQEAGTTLIDYINTQRVNRAAQLLEHSSHTIAAVAEEVGILDVNYFTKIFKKTLGVTPTRYRREHKEK